jgi:hypothetical protein
MVSRHTTVNTNLIGAVVGEGLTLTNGVLSSTGGGGSGGTDGQAVTNIVEGIVVNKALMVDESGAVTNYTDVTINNLSVGQLPFFRAGGSMIFYHPGGTDEFAPEDEVARKEDIPDLGNYTGDIITGGRIDAYSISVQGVEIGSAAFANASNFLLKAERDLHWDIATNIVWKNVYSNGWVYLMPFARTEEVSQ